MAVEQSNDPTIRELVTSAKNDLQRLVKAQVALAQAEMTQTGQAVAKTSGLFIGALIMVSVGGLFLLVTLAYVLVALGLPVWAGFGIVTLVLFIVGVVLGLLGRRSAQGIKAPERTIAEIERTKAALAGEVAPATPAVPGPGTRA